MFNKEMFADLLEKAKGNRSINRYAAESGVDASHISRLLREIIETAPTPPTIKKLANHAQNDITYENLMLAAGHLNNLLKNGNLFPLVEHKPSKQELVNLYNAMQEENKRNDDNVSEWIQEYFSPISTDTLVLPIVGTVKAGPNGLAYEDKQGYEKVDKDSITSGDYFWLKITGDSMIESGILPGDLALIRVQPEVESGELAVVIIDDEEGTLKKVILMDGGIILQPSNRQYEPRYFMGEDLKRVKIVGKVRETKRKY